MKKIFLIALAALTVMPAGAKDKDKKKEADKDSLIFTTIIEHPVTSIKNQNSSGTCWAYSSLAFLESEAIKKHPELKDDIDLCESFLISKTYVDRADKHIRTHGDASFSQAVLSRTLSTVWNTMDLSLRVLCPTPLQTTEIHSLISVHCFLQWKHT